jgi:hypothetical protein
MVVFWRGWGILVLFVPFAWLFVVVGVMIGWGTYEPDAAKAAATTYRMGALSFLLAALSLYAISHYRSRVAPGVDQFTFIPMRYWTWVVAAGAVAAFVASFFATGV